MTDSVDHDDKENNLIQRALPLPNACSGSVAGTEVTSVILLNMDSCNCTPCDSAVSLLTKAELNTLNCEDTNIRNDLLDQKSRIVLVRDRFEFTSLALQQRRDIDRRINLDEMGNVKYLCAGSNSHIFSASWQNQNVIIKVSDYLI